MTSQHQSRLRDGRVLLFGPKHPSHCVTQSMTSTAKGQVAPFVLGDCPAGLESQSGSVHK